ncbi:hypothetical protein E4U42_006508 [Claviceps africana]|uniref:Uncharacterized protein n=1 Tax=Claviceps africana TaxID=83212 RepID=A0A8K0JDU4_9HYPO|nr:hypothetical protein E4U42_006508 [Claviceps africana]
MDEVGYASSPNDSDPEPLASFSSWHNITAWVLNATRNSPFVEVIALAGPRMFNKLGSYWTVSGSMDSRQHLAAPPPLGGFSEAREQNIYNLLEPSLSFETAQISAPDGQANLGNAANPLFVEGAKGIGSVFSYATSKWAISCIAMAIILNRTYIFAATRRRIRFRWHLRFLIRLLPLVLLLYQSVRLLRSIQCQSSPDFTEYRWLDRTKSSDLASAYPNMFLNKLSSFLLLGASDRQSCEAIDMVPHSNRGMINELHGSLSTLWPSFGVLCLSHFIETLSCAVQGRPLSAETGMTLFEQSLAFAEADAAVNYQIGWTSFRGRHQNTQPGGILGASSAIARTTILSRANTTPEVLFITFLSLMTHFTSHVLGVLDVQAKYRLANTGFWGVFLMGSMIWSGIHFEFGNPLPQNLLRFPTVCIISFVPNLLVLSGIIVCSMIYGMALMLSAFTHTTDSSALNLRQRLANAHGNMQANVSLAAIRITRDMDFYTALLRTGFFAITMASEAVYLNEERNVNIPHHTWLEEARFREMEQLRRQAVGMRFENDNIGTIGLIPVKEGAEPGASGFGRERAAQKVTTGRSARAGRLTTGVAERSSTWMMALEYLLKITRLFASVGALSLLWFLGRLRLRTQPACLLWLARSRKLGTGHRVSTGENPESLGQHTPYSPDGHLDPGLEGIDIEFWFRQANDDQDEANLDAELYNYWASGGWWGVSDMSGDYVPKESSEVWDTTSVLSASSVEADGEGCGTSAFKDDNHDNLIKTSGREGRLVADPIWDTNHLARLLHPATFEEQEEARALSAHLQCDKIMTRSAFRRHEQIRRGRILLPTGLARHNMSASMDRNAGRSPDDFDQALEQMLLSRRRRRMPASLEVQANSSIELKAEESQSLPCVVCHMSARTIIVWPCRCLSLCDDCRVSLAMNNFDKCVCCRRDVHSFSRIYVP